MNYESIVIGMGTFIIIGVSHPIVIKGEYYFSKKIWVAFLFIGLALLLGALLTQGRILSSLLAVSGFTFLWGIHEVIQQEKRVLAGRFPKNPKRLYPDKDAPPGK